MVTLNRIRKLQERVKASGLDAFVATYIPDLVYLAGIPMEGYWMAASQNNWWVITNRLLDGAFRDMGVTSQHLKVQMNFKSLLEELIKKEGWQKVGFDGSGASYELGKYFEGLGFQSRLKFLGPLRERKDKEEISRIRAACRITAQSMNFIAKRMKPGMVESKLA